MFFIPLLTVPYGGAPHIIREPRFRRCARTESFLRTRAGRPQATTTVVSYRRLRHPQFHAME